MPSAMYGHPFRMFNTRRETCCPLCTDILPGCLIQKGKHAVRYVRTLVLVKSGFWTIGPHRDQRARVSTGAIGFAQSIDVCTLLPFCLFV